MVSKSKIVAILGEESLVLPERIARSLIANDQVKYYFALLQTARANAEHPRVPIPDMKVERLASQITDASLDAIVGLTRKIGEGRYRVPRSSEIVSRIEDSIAEMLACLPEVQRVQFQKRTKALDLKIASSDEISGQAIDTLTSGNREAGDSPHLLVMDVHRAINVLQAQIATETIDGASVFGLSDRSKILLKAFMAGLNRTAPLKFNHPGLATTATEHGGHFLIQNDIGTTDAHVLVLRVTGKVATLTYTDIHNARLKFFTSLFPSFAVDWQHTDIRTSDRLDNSTYLLATGTYSSQNDADLSRYLEQLGSRIVYLIDWNKARKRLRGFVSKESAIDVLKWAAEHDFGHRALLEIGGSQALAEAVEYAAGDTLHYGDRLDTLIGEDNAERFLKRALEISSIGMRHGRSRRLIGDEIKAELRSYFEKSRLTIFDIAARHAEIGFDLAMAFRVLLEDQTRSAPAYNRLAVRAAEWEQRADQVLNEARDDIRKFGRGEALLSFFEHADDAVDEMEDAAALCALVPATPLEIIDVIALRKLGDLVLAAAQELVKLVECAATISRSDVREDFDDFLTSIGRLIELEHGGDASLRAIRASLFASSRDPRALFLVYLLAQALEKATDAYAHAGQALRNYLLEEVLS